MSVKSCKFLVALLVLFSVISSFALDIPLKSGKICKDVKIVSKNQFGIHIFEKKNPADGKDVIRYISFAAMNPEILKIFPYCDTKVVDRLNNALHDRKDLIEKRFKKRLQE